MKEKGTIGQNGIGDASFRGDIGCGQLFPAPDVATLFHPAPRNVSVDTYATLRKDMLRYLSRRTPDDCVLNRAIGYQISDKAGEVLRSVGRIIGVIAASPSEIRLPDTNPERTAFVGMLLDQKISRGEKKIKIIAPVCPDYGQGDQFYQNIKGGISPEAQGAIKAARVLSRVLFSEEIDYEIAILVADTEDDKPEIIARCAQGDINRYKASCQESVGEIQAKILNAQTRVNTFTGLFGDRFRKRQYEYEDFIREKAKSNPKLSAEIASVSAGRSDRHRQILGRPEVDHELTVRYMAQYAALGSIGRELGESVVFLNYDTPNRVYFNAGLNKGISLRPDDTRAVPVLGSIVNRQK